MIRIFLLFLTIFAIYLGFHFLHVNDGPVVIEIMGYVVKTSAFFLIGTIIISIFFFMTLYKIIYNIINFPFKLIGKYSNAKKEKIHQEILSAYGFCLMGDFAKARKIARKYKAIHEKNISKNLLMIFAITEESANSKIYYLKELMNYSEFKSFAVRNIAFEYFKQKEYKQSLHYAQEARNLNNKDQEVLLLLMELYGSLKIWPKFLYIVDLINRNPQLQTNKIAKKIAYYYYISAQSDANNNINEAISKLEKSCDYSLEYPQIIEYLVKLYVQQNKSSQAQKFLINCFEKSKNWGIVEIYAKYLNNDPQKSFENFASIITPTKQNKLHLAALLQDKSNITKIITNTQESEKP